MSVYLEPPLKKSGTKVMWMSVDLFDEHHVLPSVKLLYGNERNRGLRFWSVGLINPWHEVPYPRPWGSVKCLVHVDCTLFDQRCVLPTISTISHLFDNIFVAIEKVGETMCASFVDLCFLIFQSSLWWFGEQLGLSSRVWRGILLPLRQCRWSEVHLFQ